MVCKTTCKQCAQTGLPILFTRYAVAYSSTEESQAALDNVKPSGKFKSQPGGVSMKAAKCNVRMLRAGYLYIRLASASRMPEWLAYVVHPHGYLTAFDHRHPDEAASHAACSPQQWGANRSLVWIRDAKNSPQPDRLLAVSRARSPLTEAARPLLQILSDLPRLDRQVADVHFRVWLLEVASFQSVCQDVRIRDEVTVCASYALCAALDELVTEALYHRGGSGQASGGGENAGPVRVAETEEAVGPVNADGATASWVGRSLAVHFHGDTKGGMGVFRVIGRLVSEPQEHIDLLELMWMILRLGFMGVYRQSGNGRREIENMSRQIHVMVNDCRRAGSPELLAHWQRMEVCCATRNFGVAAR
jgi:type VI protein secretion system component VasF